MYRVLNSDQIYQAIVEAYKEISCKVDTQVLELISAALIHERSDDARQILQSILDNSCIAQEEHLVPCQDTGSQIVFAELGTDLLIPGETLESIINRAVAQATQENCLRASILADPLFDRVNTTNNCPAVFHVKQVPGDKLKLHIAQKGGGAENMSSLYMLKPSSTVEDIIQTVLKTVLQAGGKACPPVLVGVGIGGNFEMSAWLAKYALLKKPGTPNPDPRYAELEKQMLRSINESGLGPMGRGGDTTALAVHIEYAPCHLASLPLAVNLQCHSHKHTELTI